MTRRIPAAGLALLRDAGAALEVGQDEESGLAPAVLLEAARRADVLVTLLSEPVGRAVLVVNPLLRGVANYAVGFDNIDVAAATELGIPVSNTPDVLTEATADFTWALLLGVARRVVEAHRYTVEGRYRIWGPNLLLGADVGRGPAGRPKVLGIVGFGRIGAAVARRATGFDMDVLAFDPHAARAIEAAEAVRAADLDALLAASDFVSLHPALTRQTRHMIGERQLRTMKPTAYLINASRGPVVDERSLVRALREHWIAGAALDVYEHEPAIADGLRELPNVLLAPHVASATVETRAEMARIAARNAIAHLRGERAAQCINPDVYDTAAYHVRVHGLDPYARRTEAPPEHVQRPGSEE